MCPGVAQHFMAPHTFLGTIIAPQSTTGPSPLPGWAGPPKSSGSLHTPAVGNLPHGPLQLWPMPIASLRAQHLPITPSPSLHPPSTPGQPASALHTPGPFQGGLDGISLSQSLSGVAGGCYQGAPAISATGQLLLQCPWGLSCDVQEVSWGGSILSAPTHAPASA